MLILSGAIHTLTRTWPVPGRAAQAGEHVLLQLVKLLRLLHAPGRADGRNGTGTSSTIVPGRAHMMKMRSAR